MRRFSYIVLLLWMALPLYARITFSAAIASGSPAGCGDVFVAYVTSGSPAPDASAYTEATKTITTSTGTYDGYYLAVANPGFHFVGWYNDVDATDPMTTDNPAVYTQTNKSSLVRRTRYALFEEVTQSTLYFAPATHGSYTCHITGQTEDLVGQTLVDVSEVFDLEATPDPGYKIMAWYHEVGGVRSYFSNATSLTAQKFESGTVGVTFAAEDLPVWLVRDSARQVDYYFDDLDFAIDTAVAIRDREIREITTTVELASSGILPTGDYLIPERVILYIPHNEYHVAPQASPDVALNEEDWRWSTYNVTEYRCLTLTDGCDLVVDGIISIGGTQAECDGGNPSGYPVGPCGRIDMSQGGSITLNEDSRLYCWGFLTGQSVVDGNNTKTVGTIHALSGSAIYEYFAVADWRGGNATVNIVLNTYEWRVFPFTNYFIQNVEVPITFEYGSAEFCSTAVQAGSLSMGLSTIFCLIGSEEAMFSLTDENSMVRTWYDPTTDHMVYELNGTADISMLKVKFFVDVNSRDYNLPIPSSMHIKLRNCSLSVSNPLTIQAGAVFEIMPDASLTLDTSIYVFDHDDWGKFVNGYYYRSLNRTMTPHFDRGEGDVNNLEDAKIIVDGTLTIGEHGHFYCTHAGANICGNGGGHFIVTATVPDSSAVVQLLDYDTPSYVPIYAAKLCSENGTYLPSEDLTHYYNIAGRWFRAANKDPKTDHTWDYAYIRTDAQGEFVKADSSHFVMDTTAAVLWLDANGMSHWTDVRRPTGSECYVSNDSTWIGTDSCLYYYNGAEWIRLVPVSGTSQFGGSDNYLYSCAGGMWIQGEGVDDDCLYTIDAVKSALVEKSFVPVVRNAPYDYAWHRESNPGEYYICFAGCDWRRAERIPGRQLAYYVYPTLADFERGNYETYLWIADSADWVRVEYEDPYFYTMTDENLRLYWDYYPAAPGQTWGTWEVAQPIVRVDYGYSGLFREFFNLPDAILFASTKSLASITLQRDIVTDKAMRYAPNVPGSRCTLDLNGHSVISSANRALTIDYTYCSFEIKDSDPDKAGSLNLLTADTKTSYALYVATGTLLIDSVMVSATNTAGSAYALYTNTEQHTSMPFGYLSARSKGAFSAPVAGPQATTILYDGYLTSSTNVSRYLPECITTRKLSAPVTHNGIGFTHEITLQMFSITVLTDNPAQGTVSAIIPTNP